MLETKTNDYFSQHGTRAIIDSFNEYRSEIDRTTKTILSEHRIPEIYRTQIDFNSQLALDKLSNFEKMFRQTANDLKNDYKFLKKRGKEAKHISKIPIDENYDESSINKIISDTEKAQLLLHKHSIAFLETSIQQEINGIITLENSNFQKRLDINSRQKILENSIAKYQKTQSNKNNDNFDHLFKVKVPTLPMNDTQARIDQLCRNVLKRREKNKLEKEAIRKLEAENLKKREELEDKLNEKKSQIQTLDAHLQSMHDYKKECEKLEEEIKTMKVTLNDLHEQRLVIERQNYTVTRDKLYNEKYKQKIDALREGLQKKKDEMASHVSKVAQIKENIAKLEKEVREKDQKLKDDEKQISEIEKLVSESDNKFQTTIDESKKEIDALSEISEYRKKYYDPSHDIHDEITELFNNPQSLSKPATIITSHSSPHENSPPQNRYQQRMTANSPRMINTLFSSPSSTSSTNSNVFQQRNSAPSSPARSFYSPQRYTPFQIPINPLSSPGTGPQLRGNQKSYPLPVSPHPMKPIRRHSYLAPDEPELSAQSNVQSSYVTQNRYLISPYSTRVHSSTPKPIHLTRYTPFSSSNLSYQSPITQKTNNLRTIHPIPLVLN